MAYETSSLPTEYIAVDGSRVRMLSEAPTAYVAPRDDQGVLPSMTSEQPSFFDRFREGEPAIPDHLTRTVPPVPVVEGGRVGSIADGLSRRRRAERRHHGIGWRLGKFAVGWGAVLLTPGFVVNAGNTALDYTILKNDSHYVYTKDPITDVTNTISATAHAFKTPVDIVKFIIKVL